MNTSAGTAIQPWAGLILGALAWSVNTQLGEMLPYSDCVASVRSSPLYSAALGLLALAGAGWSWFGVRQAHALTAGELPSPRFSSSVAALAGLIFAFAIGLQGAASILLSGCER
jgi:hypothetical protein